MGFFIFLVEIAKYFSCKFPEKLLNFQSRFWKLSNFFENLHEKYFEISKPES